jgi:hypothetical protein
MERVLSVVGQVCLGLALFCALALVAQGFSTDYCTNGRKGVECFVDKFGVCDMSIANQQCDLQFSPQCICQPASPTGCSCRI